MCRVDVELGASSSPGFSALSFSSIPSDLLVSFSVVQPPAAAAPITNVSPPTAVVFEPILPSTTTLIGMTVILILCAVVAWVWQTQVVPTSRTNLAISKARGPVKQYLDELREAGPTLLDDEVGETVDKSRHIPPDEASSSDLGTDDALPTPTTRSASSRAFERWLFTDWLRDNKSARKAGRQKEPALPILKDAKWNSGDNPVLAATLLIGIGVLFSAVTERVATTTF